MNADESAADRPSAFICGYHMQISETYVQILINPEAGVLKIFQKTWFLSELVLNLKNLKKYENEYI